MQPAYLEVNKTHPISNRGDHHALEEILELISSSTDLCNGPSVSRTALNRHLTLHEDLVVTHRNEDGQVNGLSIASDYGLRAVISNIAVASNADHGKVAQSLLLKSIRTLEKRGARRILVRGDPSLGEDYLSSVGFRFQPGECFLNLPLETSPLILARGVASNIGTNNPWLNSSELDGLLHSESVITSVIKNVASLKGVQFAPWENEERIREFVECHGLLIGHVLHDLLSFGFFSHSGIDGMVFHLGRMNHEKPGIKGLGIGLVELGVGYLAARGLERIILCTDNEKSTTFWQNRGWNVEQGINLWQLDLNN